VLHHSNDPFYRERLPWRLGLVSGFGMVTYDRCLCTGAVILGRSK